MDTFGAAVRRCFPREGVGVKLQIPVFPWEGGAPWCECIQRLGAAQEEVESGSPDGTLEEPSERFQR